MQQKTKHLFSTYSTNQEVERRKLAGTEYTNKTEKSEEMATTVSNSNSMSAPSSLEGESSSSLRSGSTTRTTNTDNNYDRNDDDNNDHNHNHHREDGEHNDFHDDDDDNDIVYEVDEHEQQSHSSGYSGSSMSVPSVKDSIRNTVIVPVEMHSTPTLAAMAFAITNQPWEILSLGADPKTSATSDFNVIVERIVSLLLVRTVALVAYRKATKEVAASNDIIDAAAANGGDGSISCGPSSNGVINNCAGSVGALSHTARSVQSSHVSSYASSKDILNSLPYSDLSTTTICKVELERKKPWMKPITSRLVNQLRLFVRRICEQYHRYAHYHNVEHAYHVVLSANKLLDIMLQAGEGSTPGAATGAAAEFDPDSSVTVSGSTTGYAGRSAGGSDEKSGGTSENGVRHCHHVHFNNKNNNADDGDVFIHKKQIKTFGLKLDPLSQLALIFAALAHDVDHRGVSNQQLVNECDELAILYNDQSVAEQRSLAVCFSELMKDEFKDLRTVWFVDGANLRGNDEYKRFRKVVINLVLTTDVASPERTQIVKSKWKEAFGDTIEALERKRDRKAKKEIVLSRRSAFPNKSASARLTRPRASASLPPNWNSMSNLQKPQTNLSGNVLVLQRGRELSSVQLRGGAGGGRQQRRRNSSDNSSSRSEQVSVAGQSTTSHTTQTGSDVGSCITQFSDLTNESHFHNISRGATAQVFGPMDGGGLLANIEDEEESEDSSDDDSSGYNDGEDASRAMVDSDIRAAIDYNPNTISENGEYHEDQFQNDPTEEGQDLEDVISQGMRDLLLDNNKRNSMTTTDAVIVPGSNIEVKNDDNPSELRNRLARGWQHPSQQRSALINGDSQSTSGISCSTGVHKKLRDSADMKRSGSAEMLTSARSVTSAHSKRIRLGIARSIDLSGKHIETYQRSSKDLSSSSLDSKFSLGDSCDMISGASSMFRDASEIGWDPDEPDELKATVVLEQIIKAADVAHLFQGWDPMAKWSSRLFFELKTAYDHGRSDFDPQDGWFEGQISFIENYAVPLGNRLIETGVFGDDIGPMFTRAAIENRDRWLTDGLALTSSVIQEWDLTKHRRNCMTKRFSV